jgi:hypothetical protein
MVVVMMWCALNVMMVMYLLTWAALWETRLSSIKGSGTRDKCIVVGLGVVMMVVMVTVLISTCQGCLKRGEPTDGVAHGGGGVQCGYACYVSHHARRRVFPSHHYCQTRTRPRPLLAWASGPAES